MSTELGFFTTVLTLFEKRMNYDTFVLAKCGVVPSKTQSYKVKLFSVIDFILFYSTDAISPSLFMHSWKTLCQPLLNGACILSCTVIL